MFFDGLGSSNLEQFQHFSDFIMKMNDVSIGFCTTIGNSGSMFAESSGNQQVKFLPLLNLYEFFWFFGIEISDLADSSKVSSMDSLWKCSSSINCAIFLCETERLFRQLC
jgi:hypothetical protein